MRDRLAAKLAELQARRAELVTGVHQHDGAIAVLEALLKETAADPPSPPKES